MSRKAAPSPADGRSWKTETDQIRIIPVSMMYVEPKSAPLRYVERWPWSGGQQPDRCSHAEERGAKRCDQPEPPHEVAGESAGKT
jgi:hypothetical protein